MPRRPVFQRKVKLTEITVEGVDLETKEIITASYEFRRPPASDEKALEKINANEKTEHYYRVLDRKDVYAQYVLPEDEFFKYAKRQQI